MTESVKQLVEESGFPGMKVLEFAFDERDTGNASDYLPHNYCENSVAYTGTHDNETINGWLKTISENEKKMVKEYLNAKYIPDEELYWAIVCEVMKSHAHMCIIPMQDYLGCDNNSRINQPSTVGKNWRWRITEEELSTDIQKKIREITRRYGRLCWQWEKLLDSKQSK